MTPEDDEIGFITTDTISFRTENKTVITLHPDGSVTYGEGITPSEAAQAFWNAVGQLLDMQPFAQEAASQAYEDAARAVETSEVYCEHGCTDRHAAIIRAILPPKG